MSERWFVVNVKSPSEEMKPILAEGLVVSGAGGAEEDGPWLRAWLPAPADPLAEAESIAGRMTELAGEPVELTWEWRDGADWTESWRRGLEPRRVGRRLIVSPPWCAPSAAPDDIVIVIDPGMAFGTGEHATTRGCLRLLEDVVAPDARVLDVGTGSGVLAIAAARIGASVDALDDDPVATDVAAENADVNGVADRIRFVTQSARPDGWLPGGPGAYDVVVANILSSILTPLLPVFHTLLRPAAPVVLGGILRQEAPEMRAALGRAGFAVEAEDEEGEWWSVRARRR